MGFVELRQARGVYSRVKTGMPILNDHIHIPKGKLLMRCLWKDGLPLHSKTWNQLSSSDDMGCTGFYPVFLC